MKLPLQILIYAIWFSSKLLNHDFFVQFKYKMHLTVKCLSIHAVSPILYVMVFTIFALFFPFLFKASRLWCSNWYDIWKWVCLMYIYSPFFNPRCFKRTLDLDVGAYAIKKLYSTTKWITWDVTIRCYKQLYSHLL